MQELSVSWSEIKTYQRCPKQWEYKYEQKLVPKRKQRPLFLGSWVHSALESHYKVDDWRVGHKIYLTEYNKLFDEEKEELDKRGALPDLVTRIMKSYIWYNRDDGWKVVETEIEFKDVLLGIADGIAILLKGIIDLIIEDREGHLWVVDHKTASTIPEANAFHAMDPQLMIYPWAAEKAWGMQVTGIIYNYVKSKAPSIPQLNKDGSISRRKILTDYPTAYRFYRENGYDPNDFREVLLPLYKRSPFLRRYRLPREDRVVSEILRDTEAVTTDIAGNGRRTRTITRDCARMCPYHDLCRAELNGFETSHMRRSDFTIRKSDSVEINIDFDDDSEEE